MATSGHYDSAGFIAEHQGVESGNSAGLGRRQLHRQMWFGTHQLLEIVAVDDLHHAFATGTDGGTADGAGEVGLYDAPLAVPTAWLFGNEAWGLPPHLAELADHRVAIPIHGRADSLNLSTAAALCLYESARRRPGPDPA